MHAFLFLVCPTKQKSLLIKRAPEHALSVLKPNSFVLKWKRVVSVLSPLSLFSRGGSHIDCYYKEKFQSSYNSKLYQLLKKDCTILTFLFTQRDPNLTGMKTSDLLDECLLSKMWQGNGEHW